MFIQERKKGFQLPEVQWDNLEKWIYLWEEKLLTEKPNLELDFRQRIRYGLSGGGFLITLVKQGRGYCVKCETNAFAKGSYAVPAVVDESVANDVDRGDYHWYRDKGFTLSDKEWEDFDVWQMARNEKETEVAFEFVSTGIGLMIMVRSLITGKQKNVTDFDAW